MTVPIVNITVQETKPQIKVLKLGEVGPRGEPGAKVVDWYRDGGGLVHLQLDDGSETDGIAIAAGPTGPAGPAGLNGSGGPVGTAVFAGQRVLSSGPGTASKFGRRIYDFVDAFDADPTGVTSCVTPMTNALATMEAAGGGLLLVGPGTYLFPTNYRPTLKENIGVLGEGSGISTFKFTHIDGGMNFGQINVLAMGGTVRNITLDGTNTTRNLNYWGHITGWVIEDLELIKSGWDPSDPDHSAAQIQEQAGNCDIRNMRINNHLGHGLIADRGAGGHSWKRGRIAICSQKQTSPGVYVNAHNIWFRRTGPTGGVDVYDGFPTDWFIENVFVEGASPGQTILNRYDACKSLYLNYASNAGSTAGASSTITIIRIGADASKIYFTGMDVNGSFAGNDTSNMTLMELAAGANEIYFVGRPSTFQRAGTGIKLAPGIPNISLYVPPIFTNVVTKFSGTNLSRLRFNYMDRYIDQVASGENRGQVLFKAAPTIADSDSLYISARGAGNVNNLALIDLLNSAFIPDWSANTVYFKNQVVLYQSTLYRANAFFTSGVSFDAANWTALGGGGGSAETVNVQPTTGGSKTLPPGFDTYVYTLTSNGGATITLPSATIGSKVIHLKALAGVRPYTLVAPSGTTLVTIGSVSPLTGSVAGGKSDFITIWCDTVGVWYVKATDLNVAG